MAQLTDSVTFETPLATCRLVGDLLRVRTKDVERTEKKTREHYEIIKSKANLNKVF